MTHALLALACIGCISVCCADTVEERRVALAAQALSRSFDITAPEIPGEQTISDFAEATGRTLWNDASRSAQSTSRPDDRPLYWQRLAASRALKQQAERLKLSEAAQKDAVARLEAASRGRLDLDFISGADKRILLTGFDPFFLDRDIAQSNPSGVVALSLDGQVIEHQGGSAEIQSVFFPVRFEDFDQGAVETLLTPIYRAGRVHMVVTVSMGREGFDLERFPGRRRSATAPDNLNRLTGATAEKPLIPMLDGRPLSGPEFVEFSLPAAVMLGAEGRYPIRDNRTVTTLAGTLEAHSVQRLDEEIAVRGSGGGYLSNEISYRSIRLRNMLGSTVATGHIHTPAFRGHDPEAAAAILAQVTNMLKQALTEI